MKNYRSQSTPMNSFRHPVLGPLSPREFLVASKCPRRWAIEASQPGTGRVGSYEELQRAVACDAAEQPGRLRDVVVGDKRIQAVLDFLEPDDQVPGGMRLVLCRGALRLKGRFREEAHLLSLCARISGYNLSSVVVLLVEKEYRVADPAHPDPDLLFRSVPLSLASESELDKLDQELDSVRALLESLSDAALGDYPSCGSPNCSCRRYDLPEHNVFTLFLSSGAAERFMEQGIQRIVDIPEGAKLGRRQSIQREALIRNEPYIDRVLIRNFVGGLRYPVGYLDFEAIASPVPLYSGTSPWQYVPFLFSLHVEDEIGVPARHTSFYCRPELDERAELASQLGAAIAGLNSIVVFDASLEKRIMRSLLAAGYLEDEMLGVTFAERIVDLLPLFREFGWYSPKQRGRVSLKSILPLMTNQVGYTSLDVADGLSAGVEYLAARRDAVLGHPTQTDRGELEKNLVEYCAVDTLGLYYIVNRLRSLANGSSGNATPIGRATGHGGRDRLPEV
ncbi:MAG: DUF2779 domain-containing protein [Spirochaetaceae bacterium]|nr:MAG: DUF2779 domain-containing protein [Spirochaetaceae bacterium]